MSTGARTGLAQAAASGNTTRNIVAGHRIPIVRLLINMVVSHAVIRYQAGSRVPGRKLTSKAGICKAPIEVVKEVVHKAIWEAVAAAE
jgi:hypothetical protein